MLIPFMKEYTKEPPPKVDYHTVERIWMTHIGQGNSNPAPEHLICAYSLTLYLPG
jgi:hypothetical protein